MRKTACSIAFSLLFAALAAATPGSFRGVVILGPDHEPGWIMVRGANGQLRRVGISRAEVVYAESVPLAERQKKAAQAIVHGVEVRVTAEQDDHGDWSATRVEILNLKTLAPSRPSARSPNLQST